MPRVIRVAAAQVGAVHVDSPREETLKRIIKLVEDAAAKGVKLVVLPETALTTFFPRHVGLDKDPKEFDKWYEEGDIVTGKNVKPLFDRAAELGVSVCVGYAEKTTAGERYNTCSYVYDHKELAKYRKVHLPGTVEPFANPNAINQLEKRYFLPGNLGFKVSANVCAEVVVVPELKMLLE
jgi:predicted amidohydrolase